MSGGGGACRILWIFGGSDVGLSVLIGLLLSLVYCSRWCRHAIYVCVM